MAWFVVRFLAYRLGSHFSEEVNPVGKCSRVGSFHASRYVAVKLFFLWGELVSWKAQKLTDDCQLFDVVEACRIIGGGLVNAFAASDPHRVGVVPDHA